MKQGPPSMEQRAKQSPEGITSQDIINTTKTIHLNGIIYMPAPDLNPQTFSRIGQKFQGQAWFKNLGLEDKDFESGLEAIENDGDIFEESNNRLFRNMSPKDGEAYYNELSRRLIDAYVYYKCNNKNQDPEWFAKLDPETQKVLSFKSVWNRQVDFPPHLRFAPMLYAGVNCFAIENVSVYEDLDKVFNLFRLNGIRQFEYKQDPLTIQHEQRQRIREFSHQRYRHVFSVLAIANLMGTNARLSSEDLRILQIAAVTHDYRTPAGGDTTKVFIDPEIFDEDKHYNEIFLTRGWRDFAKKYAISKEQETKLYKTVLGEGVLGEILDIADKTTYIAGDTDMYLNAPHFASFFRNGPNTGGYDEMGNLGFQAIKSITASDPLVCNLWDCVLFTDNKVVITNGEKLAKFLKLRALMFKELYNSQYSRFFFEVFVGRVIKYLWDQGVLTKEMLLKGDDGLLNTALGDFIGLALHLMTEKPEKSSFQVFENPEEANQFARQFNNNPDKIAIVDDFKILPNSATKKFLVKKEGKILPFNEAFSKEVKEIEDIVNSLRKISVYVLSLDDLRIPNSHRGKVKAIFKMGK